MTDNIINLPNHIRRQRTVSAEQVALAMAGVYDCLHLRDLDRHSDVHNVAVSYWHIILYEVRSGKLTYKNKWQDIGENIVGAEFYSNEIWPWALKELSDESPWYSPDGSALPALKSNSLYPRDMPPTLRKSFPPQNAALLLIAALTRTLAGKHKGVYTWGKDINKSKIAQDAAEAIAGFMDGYTNDKTESFRKLIAEALQSYPENPEDY
ncbi:hypothetical protein [Erwinia psidii]|uniref:Uncharacterized protein n=1 Tax=Erwinia psidii TaxID=69224 RepID=A0A3N6S2R5_9GAMM|nr:hypothetical protein [Erwinia psidii]MCX8964980.1 hypothetical protein [Erwinia psidii]RQM39874.1 hypothetical protein EB241_00735 [Erwinia psidii]